ncbi:MAG: phosphoribosylamine--glycine ligase [Fimbriimonadaceae bacterium]|nr:phosphoribosylamine--glycine ligase [Fimbriimonadaceae bacterium]QYK58782.1 MAG: phosphoribosylamine--glycine ligase [Fimbriimonadaceae bacterium]
MRFLVLGAGGREHALAWKLAQEAEVVVAPGNPGAAEDVETETVALGDASAVLALAKRVAADVVVVGPEDPLIAGVADALRESGFATVGPGKEGARLEASKAWAKEAMARAGVPTAASRAFVQFAAAADYARSRFNEGHGVAVKASGAALGKGVAVCSELESAMEALERMLVHRELGEAGAEVVVEDRLVGQEFSLLTLVSDGRFFSLPVAQDHKRLLDGDEGPNTGGMGTFSPVDWVSEELVQTTEDQVVAPILAAVPGYRGVLFSGLMVVDGRPFCLEYNVRFGDPETQSVVRRLGAGFAEALSAVAQGAPLPPIEALDNCAVTVVMASAGYPGPYTKGIPITVGPLPEGVKLFHAGTALHEGCLVTAGGRVLGVSATGPTLEEAADKAYAAIGSVRFEGRQYRTDIGRTR